MLFKKKEDIQERRQKIQKLGLSAIEKYFGINPKKLDKQVLIHLWQQAKIGMQFEKEQNVNKRAIENNYLKTFKMIAENRQDFKKLLKGKLPHYLPEETNN